MPITEQLIFNVYKTNNILKQLIILFYHLKFNYELCYNSIMLQKFIYIILLISAINYQLSAQKPGSQLFDKSYVHEIRLEFEEDNFWEILVENYGNGEWIEDPLKEIPYHLAKLYIDGTYFDSIGIRLKGFSSYFMTYGNKKSMKIDLNMYDEN